MRVVARYTGNTSSEGVSYYQFVLAFSPKLLTGFETYAVPITDIGQTETEVLAEMQSKAVELGNIELVRMGLPPELNITSVRGGTL